MPVPVIAIVGRPNVGKSSLLNALAARRVSIVQDMPGVTRDRVSHPLQLRGKWVELVDTGGYGFDDAQGLTEHIKHQIELAVARADLVMFVVDAHEGLLEADRTVATLLREKNVRTLFVANKCDAPSYEQALGDFARLGLGTPLGVSATTSHNLDLLRESLADRVRLEDAPSEMPDPELLIAIVGKRNAGKSTLVNAISMLFGDDPDRVIVSEVPGTTRDSVDVRFEKDGQVLTVIDTAGVRKKRHMVNDDIEFYSFHRAERSIRRADVVVQLIDSMEPVSEPDKKLGAYILEQEKPVILTLNKWDLALEGARKQVPVDATLDEETLREQFREYVHAELPGLNFAPLMYLTARNARNVQRLLDQARALHKQNATRVSTSQLNNAIETVLAERTPGGSGRKHPKVYYATQVSTEPPAIVLFVNHEQFFDESFKRFVINRLRQLLPFQQVPIKLMVRPKSRSAARKGAPEAEGEEAIKMPTRVRARPGKR